ncbi:MULTISPECIES: LysR family transcriptional regulator [unclassified Polaromonas]|uniref:LysR family transcriptional regulator n=1 Tax=unclassified Polaromonas TaxID=2638319 RepID=UPI0018C9CC61|nr:MULTISPECIES: LysR family transcriptional regulator [unclassified Polaromonas]MBG6073126.1 LysR family transcriptional activator of nhaA [Polaromonas sp. CG_9.7]MBG6115131.1 LysR family transcriptional activator of nhaA [Polaromonas sp. CG_9.2]MDH6184959.1 LysR family transcriptional activator of nhaA [Polaromonas sp. CG_23.6]
MPFSRLNYRHLYYFWMVAKEGHLTRVAEQLHVSQSALSSQIRQLEEQMEHALFLRQGRSLQLTEVGRVVLGYADGIFALGTELVAAVAAGGGQKIQRLKVGGVANVSRNFQENFLRPIMGMEDVQLVLESGSLDELLPRLAVHKLDLVLSNRPVSADAEQAWQCRRVARQPVCLVGKPRPASRPFRFPDDLPGVKLLLPGHSSDIRTEFDMLCEHLQVKVNIFAEVDDMAMLRLLARDSGGVALLPAVVVQDELHSGVLQQYCVVPKVYENFYAISVERQFQSAVLKKLLTSTSG